MTIHHPSDELLLDYASGALPEPVALAVATHAALSPRSARRIAALESVGGAMIDRIAPVPLREDALDRALAAIEVSAAPDPKASGRTDETSVDLPGPLRPYVGSLSDLQWRARNRHVDTAVIETARPDYQVRLLRIRAGQAVPRHTHRGREFTVTLTGGYFDGFEHYARGDFQLADPSLDHRPVADEAEDCMCLAVLEAPIRFTGRLGRLANPFVRL